MLIDKIKELNDKFYEACGELHENKSHIEESHRKAVADNIFRMYELDYRLIKLTLSDIDFELEKLERRKEKLKPRTRRLWYTLFIKKQHNKAEQLIEQTAENESDEFLKIKEHALNVLKKALEAADNADVQEAFDEPQGNAQITLDDVQAQSEQKTPAAASTTFSAKKSHKK